MLKKIFFVLLSVFIIVGYAIAADWVQIEEKTYLDASSLSSYYYKLNFDKDRLYSIWEKSLNDKSKQWKEFETIIGKKLWFKKSLVIVNCTKKELTTKSSVFYDLNGDAVYSYDNSYLDWRNVVPETFGEYEYTLVCGSTVNAQNIKSIDKSTIITPEGTKIKIKYHKK